MSAHRSPCRDRERSTGKEQPSESYSGCCLSTLVRRNSGHCRIIWRTCCSHALLSTRYITGRVVEGEQQESGTTGRGHNGSVASGQVHGSSGYAARMKSIDDSITPQNRIILCEKTTAIGNSTETTTRNDVAHEKLLKVCEIARPEQRGTRLDVCKFHAD